MRLRKLTGPLTAVAAAVVAVTVLTACESNAGAAAVVDGHRISDSEVNSYVRPGGPPSDASAQPGQKVLPKTTAASFLVQAEVFRKVLAANGGVPSDSELSALHDRAAATLLQVPLKGAELDAYIAENVAKSGLDKKFAGLLFETIELEQTLIDRLQARSIEDLAKATEKVGVPVSVSKRYGTWDPAQLIVNDPTGQVPGFLTLGSSSAAPSPAPAG